MDDKIGVFICTGYGIAEGLDVDALCEVATGEFNVPFCEKVESCEGSGLATINADIQSEALTRVVVAGLSARRYDTNAFPTALMVEMVPLLEQVVWCQEPGDEDTQMLAEDNLRMAIAKVQASEPLEPFAPDEPIDKTILVVGGGITGLTAALGAADAGYAVQLVEKAEQLGGWSAKQHKSIPKRPPYRDLEETGIEQLIGQVQGHDGITVHTSATTGNIEGAPGLFDVTLHSAGNGKPAGEVVDTFRVGAIVQATGWKPTEPRDTLSYGQVPDVIRNVELEEMVKEQGQITRPSDGKPVKSIAFIQCGGSRAKEHHSHCSSICCLTSLKQATYLREQDDQAKAYIFYEFIRTPGQYEDFYRRVQEDPGVFLTRGEVTDVAPDAEGGLLVTARNTMPDEELEVKVDLVVLAAGMEPNSADGEAIRGLEDAKFIAEHGDSEVQRNEAAQRIEELQHHEGMEILNLAYRQGPDLPTLQYGYPDSHFICFPYETRRTGIYAAGCVRQPMDGLGAVEDARGAVLKAIQCVEMTSRGEAVHPRAGDTSYPDFNMQKCTSCKRCTEECPFGVLNEDEKGTPLLRATRCRRCGVCLGACPERIVSFKDYSISIVNAMIKAINIPDEFDEKPRVLAFLCENDAYPAMDLVGQRRLAYSPFIRIIPVRCLGSINVVWISEAVSAGFDGIILIGCKYGDDYQCHFIKGSELANARGDNIREKLEQMALENERVELHQLQISDFEQIPKIFNTFMEEVVDEFSMNPFKGM